MLCVGNRLCGRMSEPVVTVKQGKLRGKVDKDFDGSTYYTFLGIPFAKPPLEDLRFKLYSDAMFVAGITEFIKLVLESSKNPVFCYQFAVERQFADMLGKMVNLKFELGRGTSYGSDIPYILMGKGNVAHEPADIKIMRNIVEMWTNFARDGTPTLDGSPANWEAAKDPQNFKCLKIDEELTLIDNPFSQTSELWGKLFEEYYPQL
ncbi:uncharacterized protein LOC132697337 [Cylas formicarius]|uniref:uncharacterized protein LOC132697337 n=1 Tax=Cylas formicarius TaxID=197179 RepID=UPI0029589E3A|nr:uncharacterized protein LOC132697337 [Cylas formicarius]